MSISSRTILLTGATGYLGSHIFKLLLSLNYKVIIIKRENSDTRRIDKYLKKASIYNVEDISLEKIFGNNKINGIIHTATCYGKNKESVSSVYESNVIFPLKILQYAAEGKVDFFINTDTFFSKGEMKEYQYLNAYAISKRHVFELLSKNYFDIKIVNMRLFHLYGPEDNEDKFVPSMLAKLINNDELINLTDGKQGRDFIYIDDVVNAYKQVLLNLDKVKGFVSYDIGTATSTTIKEFLLLLQKEVRKNMNNKTEMNFGKLERRSGEPDSIIANYNSFFNDFDWHFEYDIKEGIKNIVRKYFKQKEIGIQDK